MFVYTWKMSQSGNPELQSELDQLREWITRALSESGYTVDGTLESLKEIDRFFDDHLKKPGKPKPKGLLSEDTTIRLFAIGVYSGEVVRSLIGGEWSGSLDDEFNLLQLNLSDRGVIWPTQRVGKRFRNGPEDGIYVWGYMMVNES